MLAPLLLVLAQSVSAAGELPFGRLFATAEERQTLDMKRNQEKVDVNIAPPAVQQDSVGLAPVTTQPVRLSGVVLRADGRQILWLNGAPVQQERRAPNHPVQGNRARSADLRVLLSPQQGTLKPGQIWLPGEGQGAHLSPDVSPKLPDSNIPVAPSPRRGEEAPVTTRPTNNER